MTSSVVVRAVSSSATAKVTPAQTMAKAARGEYGRRKAAAVVETPETATVVMVILSVNAERTDVQRDRREADAHLGERTFCHDQRWQAPAGLSRPNVLSVALRRHV